MPDNHVFTVTVEGRHYGVRTSRNYLGIAEQMSDAAAAGLDLACQEGLRDTRLMSIIDLGPMAFCMGCIPEEQS